MLGVIFFTAILLPNFIICVPIDSSKESLVFVGDGAGLPMEPEEPLLPQLKSMHVTSSIRNRYARTIVETKYLNPENYAQEATFTITLPNTAFISGFMMEIDGKKYEAHVKGKEEAKQEYQDAVHRGQTAGHVEMNARDSEVFTVSVNVEPLSKVLFTLTYEQLLQRKHGKYEMVINLHPRQLVDDFSVDVIINETRRIIDVDTPALRSGNEILDSKKVTNNQFATITNLNDDHTEVNVHFAPSKQEQKEIMAGTKGVDESKGISGQFVIEYDVERGPQGGEVIVDDDYFVHFFAPSDLKPIPKHIVFVLDVSGSMMGRKMKQLIEAMKVILGELNENDYFHLLKFSTKVQIWNEVWINLNNPLEFETPQPLQANKENIQTVQKVVEKMTDEQMTNIHDALAVALRLTSKGVEQHNDVKEIQPMIVFLTDGQANQGISNYDQIIKMVESRNAGENKAAIFALSFGEWANKDFLKKLASENLGLMRTIYEAADASLQLQDFYRTISSPLLTNVNFVYADQVSNLTKNRFDILFKGSELVVAGKLTDSSSNFVTDVEARTVKGAYKFIPTIISIKPKPDKKKEFGTLERLWAYLTIKQLLDKKYEVKEGGTKSSSEKEALDIALKYSFVTPVSSLVVVKPNSTEAQNTKAANARTDQPDRSYSTRAMIVPMSAGSSNVRYALRASPRGPGLTSFRKSYAPQMVHSSLMSVPVMSMPSLSMPTFSMPVQRPIQIPLHSHLSHNPLQKDLSWITPILTSLDEIKIDNNSYLLGNSSTIVGHKPCQVNSSNGTCTLLSECPQVYPELDSLDTYKNDYFCILEDKTIVSKYAGVCCVNFMVVN